MGLERIASIRKEKGITLEQLSENSGVPISTLKKISAGITTNPNLDTLKAIARSLECTLDDFDDVQIMEIKEESLATPLSKLDIDILNKCASFPSPERVKQHISGYLDFLASESLVFSDDLPPDDDEILQAHTEEIERNQNSSSRKAAR